MRLQIDFRHRLAKLLIELGQPPLRLPPLGELIDQMPDLLGRKGLGQIVDRPALQGLDGGFDRGISRQHDDIQPRVFGQQLGQQIQPTGLAQPQIEKDQVERALSQRRQRFVGRGGHPHLAAHALQTDRERDADVLLVVDDQNAEHIGPVGRA